MFSRLLLVGLGNPGARYAMNRHNIGFMALDAIACRWGLSPFRARFHGLLADGRIGDRDVLALKPTTFVNGSGLSVGEAARFFKIPPEDVIVFHDELDLPEGRVRVKEGGGHAGHNGLKSIDAHLGADYRRVRLGIGHPGDKARVLGYVLADFTAADAAWLGPLLQAIAEHLALLIAGDAAAYMSKVALDLGPSKANPSPRDDPARGGKDAPGGI